MLLVQFSGFWTAEKLGKTKICIFFDGNLVREYLVTVQHGEDITKCRATGEGLECAIVGMPAKFLVDVKVVQNEIYVDYFQFELEIELILSDGSSHENNK